MRQPAALHWDSRCPQELLHLSPARMQDTMLFVCVHLFLSFTGSGTSASTIKQELWEPVHKPSVKLGRVCSSDKFAGAFSSVACRKDKGNDLPFHQEVPPSG